MSDQELFTTKDSKGTKEGMTSFAFFEPFVVRGS
jgi:hypothetical protein